jgi:hypothetical protein
MGTYERVPSFVCPLGSFCRYKRVLSCQGCSSKPSNVQNIFSLTARYFTSCVPIAQQAGQPALPSRLSLIMCPWSGM